MKKVEIEQFIKDHTMEFEREIWRRQNRKVSYPRAGYLRTAECNMQRRCDFNQDKVVQTKWLDIVDYIIQVSRI